VGAPQIPRNKNLNHPKEKVMKSIKRFFADESGMETLEYAVIGGLIALAAAAIYATSGTWKTTLENRLNNAAAQS
jgi:Flp pilus assembly pilin Flp